MTPAHRLVVLASGEGTNFEAIAAACQCGQIPAKVVALVCNREGAPVLRRAERFSVPTVLVPSARFRKEGALDRVAYEAELLARLERLSPDLICCAGYMLLLGAPIVTRYSGKILNIHPSLLPAFRGLRALEQALAAGAEKTGCTVHIVTQRLDDGPILAREEILIQAGDTVAKLQERLRPLEHRAYVSAIRRFLGADEDVNKR